MRNTRKNLGVLAIAMLLVGGLIAPAAATSPTVGVAWTGQGSDSEQCSKDGEGPRDGSWIHWVFTTGGNSTATDVVLQLGGTGSGSYTPASAGNIQFYTPFYELNGLTASVTFEGELGRGNENLVISDFCSGDVPASPDLVDVCDRDTGLITEVTAAESEDSRYADTDDAACETPVVVTPERGDFNLTSMCRPDDHSGSLRVRNESDTDQTYTITKAGDSTVNITGTAPANTDVLETVAYNNSSDTYKLTIADHEFTKAIGDNPLCDQPEDDTPGDDTPGDDTPSDDTPSDDTTDEVGGVVVDEGTEEEDGDTEVGGIVIVDEGTEDDDTHDTEVGDKVIVRTPVPARTPSAPERAEVLGKVIEATEMPRTGVPALALILMGLTSLGLGSSLVRRKRS